MTVPNYRHRICSWVLCWFKEWKVGFSEIQIQLLNFRSSRPEVFCKKGVVRNFAKFTGKHLCQSLFFNKVAGLRPTTFPANFAKFLRTPCFIEHLRWLLLKFVRRCLDKLKWLVLFDYFFDVRHSLLKGRLPFFILKTKAQELYRNYCELKEKAGEKPEVLNISDNWLRGWCIVCRVSLKYQNKRFVVSNDVWKRRIIQLLKSISVTLWFYGQTRCCSIVRVIISGNTQF